MTGACHTAPAPQIAVPPQVDSSALAERPRQDSIARAEAEVRDQFEMLTANVVLRQP